MSTHRYSESAFETEIEAHLLENEYVLIVGDGFDRERAIFPATVLAFIRETQPQAWEKLEALHGSRTGEQILTDLCKWMDANGSLATLRHGFKCYGRTLHAAYFKAAHELNPELECPLRGQPAGADPPTPLFATLFPEIAGRHAEPERHPCRDAGTEEPADGPAG